MTITTVKHKNKCPISEAAHPAGRPVHRLADLGWACLRRHAHDGWGRGHAGCDADGVVSAASGRGERVRCTTRVRRGALLGSLPEACRGRLASGWARAGRTLHGVDWARTGYSGRGYRGYRTRGSRCAPRSPSRCSAAGRSPPCRTGRRGSWACPAAWTRPPSRSPARRTTPCRSPSS